MRKLKAISSKAIFGLLFFISQLSSASPVIQQVAEGKASVHQEQNKTSIHQTSEKAIIHWDSFNILPHETTHFQQPQNGIALNRINSNNGLSRIDGRLTATGRIILINGAGIHFGPGSYVNVGSIIASTSNISNENFLANKYIFDQPSSKGGKIVNKGHIKAADYGLVAFVGPHIENHGLIEANMGTVALGAGNKATLDFHGNDLIHFTVDDSLIDPEHPQVKNRVEHTGKIYADGGKILVHAASASRVLDNVINMKGVAVARSVEQRNGVIILHAGPYGRVKVAGRLDASGRSAGSRGGKIKVVGRTVKVKAAELDVSGHSGGGTILLGSESRKPNTPITSEKTVVTAAATLQADALASGNGGNIIIRAKDETIVQGKLSAQGGAQAGDGGFIETSSGRYLKVDDVQAVLKAVNGKVGTWSLEAQKVFIKNNKSAKFAGNWGAQFSFLDTNTLQANLATANVKIETGPSGSEDHYSSRGHLSVEDELSWHSPTTLTLSAYRNIDISSKLISNDAGGSLVLQADNKGRGEGTINFTRSTPQVYMRGDGSVIFYHNSYGNSSEPASYSQHVDLGQANRFVVVDNNYYKNPASYNGNEIALSDADSDGDFSPVGSPKRGAQDGWVWLAGMDDESWLTVSGSKPVSAGVQEEKAESKNHAESSFIQVKSLTQSDLEGFELLTESDLKQLESLHNSRSSNELSSSGVHLSQDVDLSSSWDSLASLDAAYQSRPGVEAQSELSVSEVKAEAYLTQSLEPTLALSFDSQLLAAASELFNEHPSLLETESQQTTATSPSLPTGTFAVLPASTVSAEPAIIRQPLNNTKSVPSNLIQSPVWVATPWKPASGVSPFGPPGGPALTHDIPMSPVGPPGGPVLVHDTPMDPVGPPGGPVLTHDTPVDPVGPPGGPALTFDTPVDPVEPPSRPAYVTEPDLDTLDSPREPAQSGIKPKPVAADQHEVQTHSLPCLEVRQRLDTPEHGSLYNFDQDSDLLQCPPV